MPHIYCLVSCPQSQFSGRTGFTLVEILIVITIVAVLASAVSLSVNVNSEQRELARQAQRLKHVIGFARDQSNFRREPLALEVFEDGLQFLKVDDSDIDFMEWGLKTAPAPDDQGSPPYEAQTEDKKETLLTWQVVTDDRALKPNQLPEGYTFELEVEEEFLQLSALSLAKGEDKDEREDEEEGDQLSAQPQIYFSDSGTVTPFSITITNKEEKLSWVLAISMTGEITDNPDE